MSIDHNVSDFCLATVVTPKSIEAMLEADSGGLFKDQNLWRVAETFFLKARAAQLRVPLLFAVRDGAESWFSHWSIINSIEVLELPDSRGESRCYFDRLQPFNPIWQAIDSVSNKPSDEQLSRERLEGARTLRWPLQDNQLHPYTICETPAFISALGDQQT
jgi:hypothetical protein